MAFFAKDMQILYCFICFAIQSFRGMSVNYRSSRSLQVAYVI